jgi:hypothetical protein
MFRGICNLQRLLLAAACAFVLILCYFLIRPYAEIGINDDWVYIKDALKVAQTGHISYSGTETPILGWQLYFGALFIKLFGFSFTAVRLATVIEAMATAFVLERTFERAGLNLQNATLATATFVLSPLYLPWAFAFMSDISGVLCIVVCSYMCLRALEARSQNSAMAWISLAALVNAAGGTARQIAWLGALLMVPSTLWFLRKSRPQWPVWWPRCIGLPGSRTAFRNRFPTESVLTCSRILGARFWAAPEFWRFLRCQCCSSSQYRCARGNGTRRLSRQFWLLLRSTGSRSTSGLPTWLITPSPPVVSKG